MNKRVRSDASKRAKKSTDKSKSDRKNNLITALIVAIGLIGVAIMVYPSFSDWWNSMHQSYAIASYDQTVVGMTDEERDEILGAAEAYNAELTRSGMRFILTDEQRATYESLLDVTGNGMMGYIDIPKIDITLPIYHGTSDAVLQVAIGHIEGSSLPVGGKGTHACVSGHRGLPSARLFSDLDALTTGDLFSVTVLDRTITYEVDQIRIVLPSELSDLAIDPSEDYITLITCTPYGINTHRLLVRGHRTSNTYDAVLADAVQIDPRFIALALGVPTLIVIVIWLKLATRHHRRRQRGSEAATGEFRSRRAKRSRKAAAEPSTPDVASDNAPSDAQAADAGTSEEPRHEGE